jgi:hypothetical protein
VSDLSGFLSDPQALEDMKRRALALAQSGARGFTTGLLGAPVDIANTVMGGAGGERPVMGGEWIGQKLQGMGLLSPPAQDAAGSATEFAGGLLNPGGAAKAAAIKGPALAALLFHGSPHKFDKFDMSKIGTGEGAQAYGHGLYFAESPDVAKSYKEALGGDELLVGGRVLGKSGALKTTEAQAAGLLDQHGGSVDAAKAAADKFAQQLYWSRAKADEIKAHLPGIAEQGITKRPAGALYKVDVPDEAIGKMLDWDKPLSQQPESVRKALNSAVKKMESWEDEGVGFALQPRNFKYNTDEPTGETIYSALSEWLGNKADPAAALRKLGIPGIRYLDGGSRTGGKGTSNFVLFDDKLPKIVGVE